MRPLPVLRRTMATRVKMTTLLSQNERDDAEVIEKNIVPAALAAFNPETQQSYKRHLRWGYIC
jgi:hypothetical protein